MEMGFEQLFRYVWLTDNTLIIFYCVPLSCSHHHLSDSLWLTFEFSSWDKWQANWWLAVHDPKPPVQFSRLVVITLSVNEMSLCFDLITHRRSKLETKHPPIIYPSQRQAFSAELLTGVFSCLGSLQIGMNPLHLTMYCQNTVTSLTCFVDLHSRIYHLTRWLCIIHWAGGGYRERAIWMQTV